MKFKRVATTTLPVQQHRVKTVWVSEDSAWEFVVYDGYLGEQPERVIAVVVHVVVDRTAVDSIPCGLGGVESFVINELMNIAKGHGRDCGSRIAQVHQFSHELRPKATLDKFHKYKQSPGVTV